ncbi:hypothetical protein FACS1894217_13700 [Clostridia bacterium]|nr:hypothetical protein FACS1894217_13700 [Clostridia bacterium]
MALKTRATVTGSPVENNCDRCSEPLIFAMRDKEHEFSLGLLTVLDCLKLAEKEGAIPELSSDWWFSVEEHFQKSF